VGLHVNRNNVVQFGVQLLTNSIKERSDPFIDPIDSLELHAERFFEGFQSEARLRNQPNHFVPASFFSMLFRPKVSQGKESLMPPQAWYQLGH